MTLRTYSITPDAASGAPSAAMSAPTTPQSWKKP